VTPRERLPSVLDATIEPSAIATHVRGSVLQSSLRVITEAQRFERYVAFLSPAHRDTLLNLRDVTLGPKDARLEGGHAAIATIPTCSAGGAG
jgi:hypothetical protein